jgi:hypothetical protein
MLSQNIYERGIDDAGFGRIRSKGDAALFGGCSTQEMKSKYGIAQGRLLADFLPILTIAAKNLATCDILVVIGHKNSSKNKEKSELSILKEENVLQKRKNEKIKGYHTLLEKVTKPS